MKAKNIIIGGLALIGLAGLVYSLLNKYNNRPQANGPQIAPAPNGTNEAAQLSIVKENWDGRSFRIQTPFGQQTIKGQPVNGQTVENTNANFQLVRNSQFNKLEVSLMHLNPADPIFSEHLLLDYTTQQAFHTVLTREQAEALLN